MKLEIRKETRQSGKVWYCVYLDGKWQESCLEYKLATEMYNRIKNENTTEKSEVLQSEEIETK